MANFYALPGLTTWSQSGGWSNTSGGVSNGIALPSNADIAIFDANSGVSETISLGNASRSGLVNTTGANPMTFVSGGSSGNFRGVSVTYNFTGTVSIPNIELYSASLVMGGAIVAGDVLVYDAVQTSSIAGDAVVTGNLSFTGGASSPTLNITGGANVTANAYIPMSTSTVNFGSGTFTSTGGAINLHIFDSVSSATLKFTHTTGAGSLSTQGQVPAKVWNACGPAASLSIVSPSSPITVGIFKASGGSTTKIDAGKILEATTWDVNGSGSTVYLMSTTPASTCTMTKVGGGLVEFNYSNIKDIIFSPSSTFSARNSTNGGNNTNVTFLAQPNNFMAFM